MDITEEDFRSYIVIKRGLSESSVKGCIMRRRIILEWLKGREFTKLNIEEFFMYLKDKELKNNTLNSYVFCLRYISSYFKDRGIDNNFMDGFSSFKKGKSNIILLSLEEIDTLINTRLSYGYNWGKDCSFLDDIYRTLTKFLAYTGCRFSEATKLRLENLDLETGKVNFVNTKNNDNRSTYLTQSLIADLKKLVHGKSVEELVFTNSRNKEIHPQDYSYDLKRRAIKAGIIKRIYPHLLRHCYATHMLEVEVPITDVATLIGHRDIQTTYETYTHLSDQKIKKAALRNPLTITNIDPLYLISLLREEFKKYHLENDERFIYEIQESESGFSFKITLK